MSLSGILRALRRLIIDIILIAVFVCFIGAVTVIFIAEHGYNESIALIDSDPVKAGQLFEQSISLNPFNAAYRMSFADFLVKRSGLVKNARPFLLKAEEVYSDAHKINPGSAGYLLELGKTQLILFALDNNQYCDRLYKGMSNLKAALKMDPNGFNISYSVGYSAMSIWDFLNIDEKKLVLNRLKYSLALRPWEYAYIYPHVWEKTHDFKIMQSITPENLQANESLYMFMEGNNLWQFRKDQQSRIDYFMLKEDPENFKIEKEDRARYYNKLKLGIPPNRELTNTILPDEWHGVSNDGQHKIEDGYLYWNGILYAPVILKAGEANISIEARKVISAETKNAEDPGSYPYMVVKLDDEDIGEGFVGNDGWQNYDYKIRTGGGLKILSIAFVNDLSDPEKGMDRNLAIGRATISY